MEPSPTLASTSSPATHRPGPRDEGCSGHQACRWPGESAKGAPGLRLATSNRVAARSSGGCVRARVPVGGARSLGGRLSAQGCRACGSRSAGRQPWKGFHSSVPDFWPHPTAGGLTLTRAICRRPVCKQPHSEVPGQGFAMSFDVHRATHEQLLVAQHGCQGSSITGVLLASERRVERAEGDGAPGHQITPVFRSVPRAREQERHCARPPGRLEPGAEDGCYSVFSREPALSCRLSRCLRHRLPVPECGSAAHAAPAPC